MAAGDETERWKTWISARTARPDAQPLICLLAKGGYMSLLPSWGLGPVRAEWALSQDMTDHGFSKKPALAGVALWSGEPMRGHPEPHKVSCIYGKIPRCAASCGQKAP